MKCSEWDKEIEKMSDAQLRQVSQAMKVLIEWPSFKREFAGISSLHSIISCEQTTRRYKRKELLSRRISHEKYSESRSRVSSI